MGPRNRNLIGEHVRQRGTIHPNSLLRLPLLAVEDESHDATREYQASESNRGACKPVDRETRVHRNGEETESVEDLE